MPLMRCIDNESYNLTLGNFYDVTLGQDAMCSTTDDLGVEIECFARRFEEIEYQPVVQVDNTDWTPKVGQKVRIKNDLTLSNAHADIYEKRGMTCYISSINSNNPNKFCVNIMLYTSINKQMVDLIEDTPDIESIRTPIAIPLYEQVQNEHTVKKGDRVLIPTRKSISSSIKVSRVARKAIDFKKHFLTIDRVQSSRIVIEGENYNNSDLELFATNFIQGEIEPGHRVKCSCGKTHSYRDNLSIITDNDEYLEGTDSDNWYFFRIKGLVIRPRGTLQCTEYKAMCPECYNTYKEQQTKRIAYLEALYKEEDRKYLFDLLTRQIRAEQQRQERLRQEEEERRIREEQERMIREIDRFGIWMHHDKSWI